MITPPAPMLAAKDIPREVRNAFVKALTEDELNEDAALAAAINAWPNANKAYFAQGPHLMLPVPK